MFFRPGRYVRSKRVQARPRWIAIHCAPSINVWLRLIPRARESVAPFLEHDSLVKVSANHVHREYVEHCQRAVDELIVSWIVISHLRESSRVILRRAEKPTALL